MRAVRRNGPDGEPQVFLTSLPRSPFARTDILELYRRRWEVELFYRLEKGHYVVNVRRGYSWFHIDDTLVMPVAKELVLETEAYVLFYLARDAAN